MIINVYSYSLSVLEIVALKTRLTYCEGWYYAKTGVVVQLKFWGNYNVPATFAQFHEDADILVKTMGNVFIVAKAGIDDPSIEGEAGLTYPDKRAFINLGEFDENYIKELNEGYFIDIAQKLLLHEAYHLVLNVLNVGNWFSDPHTDPQTSFT